MINNYDERQLNLMLNKIDAFINNKLEIEHLLNDLEALLKVLETIDNSWRENFYREWLNIEEMYSYALSENRNVFYDDEQKIILDSITNMKKLIFSKIHIV